MADNLYIRIAGNDTGARPWNNTDNATKSWDNDSLWLRTYPNPQDHSVHDDSNTTRVDLDTAVMVRVTNKSNAAMPGVTIQAWLFPPGFGEMKPAAKQMAFDLTPSREIPGQGSGQNVVEIEMTPLWKPSEPDYQRTSNGHYCIAANVYQSETIPNAEGRQLGANDLIRSSEDPHHAQRNLILQPAPHGSGTSSKVPTTTYPPPGGDPAYLVSAEHVTTKPSESQLAMLAHHPGVVAAGADGTRLTLDTSRGPVPITVGTEPPAFALRSDLIPGLDTLFSFATDRPDRIDTDIVVDLPEDAPIGSLHTFDVALWSERGDMIGCPLRVMILVTE